MKSKREKTKSHTLIKNVRSHISKEMGKGRALAVFVMILEILVYL